MNINPPKPIEPDIKAARNYAEAILRTTRAPLIVLCDDLRVNTANEAFYKTFQTTPGQTEGRLIYEVGNRQWDIPQLRTLLEEILPRNNFFNDFEVKHNFLHIGPRTLLLNARQLDQEAGTSPMILLSMEDTTERQRLAEHARVSEIRYRRLFEAAKDGVLLLDPISRKITDANPFMMQLLGYAREELLGKELWQLGLRRDEQLSHEAFRQLQQTGFVRYEDLPLQTKSGEKRQVEVVANRYDENGTPVIQANIRDITERKHLQQELAEIARLLDLSNDAIMVRNLDNRITMWNQGAEKLYGWKFEEVIGKDLHSLMLTEFPKPMEQIVAQLYGEGQFRGEVVQIARDGRRVHTLCRWVLDRQTHSILTSYTDISDRKQGEEALRQSEERYRTLFDLGPVAVYSCDVSGTIQDFNRRAVELWGRKPARGDTDELFCGSSQLIRPDGTILRHEDCPMAEVLAGKIPEARDAEVVIEQPNGTRITVVVNIRALKNLNGEITGAINCFYDITERKRVAEALQSAQVQLADRATLLEHIVSERTADLSATNQQLEAFVYSIAHDLRAPLRSMQGYSAMLIEEAGTVLNETARGYANRINHSAQFMDALLRDLLAFSRIAQQRVELVPLDPEPVVQAVLLRLEKDIQEKNARVEMLAPWPALLAHEPTLGQVLFNLVSNALKFTPPARSPHVRIRAEEKGKLVRVSVEDNGIGIAPAHQEQIFRLFTRLHGEKYPGTGIGLAIVQKGVERMGGQVGVESDAGQGSRFWFELRKANS